MSTCTSNFAHACFLFCQTAAASKHGWCWFPTVGPRSLQKERARHFTSGVSKDSLPGPYPNTPEERAAAAKKYNIRIEDYEPYPDKGEGFGDYPKLPDRSQHERDPWYQWDHPDLRRNWGEPMHWDFDMYIRNRVDTSPSPVSWSTMCKHLFGFIGLMLFLFYVGEKMPSYQPVVSTGQGLKLTTLAWEISNTGSGPDKNN
uniref:NADH:ubiquinone oxidoreductase subunit B8 n=1 Tax=Seriola lalandi dorsalis TaxID=1841481 RepID=A0A3B4WY56_SERLL